MTLSTDTSVTATHSVAAAGPSRPWRDHKKPLWVLTWVPAIWRRVMDPRVIARFDGAVTRANLHPEWAWPDCGVREAQGFVLATNNA